MIDHKKYEKALKLFQHALALSPEHPDILNEYGEFLEQTQRDIVLAEHMYCRALILSPSHTKALANRERTLPMVEEIDQEYYESLDNKRDLLINIPDSDPALRRMKKESYFKHIYHTAAIEGNTFTLMQTRSLVETRVAIGGKSVMEHNEILGMDSALSFINSSLVQRIGAITIDDILNIHLRVLGHVDPVGAGLFRTTQVFVGDFMPPEPKEVQQLMTHFIEWLNSEETLNLHPIEMAALAHYKLVYIHPFYDGNGRTSRLLMNLILMQAGYPPIIIRVEDKHEYYQHLQTANTGDYRPFIRFIARCTEMTLNEYILMTDDSLSSGVRGLSADHDDGKTIIT